MYDLTQVWDGMSTSHVITRTVRDSAAMLDAVAGPEPGAPYGIESPHGLFLEAAKQDPKRLKIGYHTRPAFGRKVHPECVQAVQHTGALLEGMGHAVEEIGLSYQEEDVALIGGKAGRQQHRVPTFSQRALCTLTGVHRKMPEESWFRTRS